MNLKIKHEKEMVITFLYNVKYRTINGAILQITTQANKWGISD